MYTYTNTHILHYTRKSIEITEESLKSSTELEFSAQSYFQGNKSSELTRLLYTESSSQQYTELTLLFKDIRI